MITEKLQNILDQNQAAYENALDYLYYGFGYKSWKEKNQGHMTDEEAKQLWKYAFECVVNDY
jgi:hypothetical protein